MLLWGAELCLSGLVTPMSLWPKYLTHNFKKQEFAFCSFLKRDLVHGGGVGMEQQLSSLLHNCLVEFLHMEMGQ